MTAPNQYQLDRRHCLAAAAAALLLLGCGKQPEAARPSEPVSVDTIASQAAGFQVGPLMTARTAYVFFDAQCPHCAALWEAAKPLKNQVRFVWIPVALLGEKSVGQGGAMLEAADPAAAMDAHEASLRERKGGITAIGVSSEKKDLVRKNTELFNRFGIASVPTIIYQPKGADLVIVEGALPTPALAQRLGLPV